MTTPSPPSVELPLAGVLPLTLKAKADAGRPVTLVTTPCTVLMVLVRLAATVRLEPNVAPIDAGRLTTTWYGAVVNRTVSRLTMPYDPKFDPSARKTPFKLSACDVVGIPSTTASVLLNVPMLAVADVEIVSVEP